MRTPERIVDPEPISEADSLADRVYQDLKRDILRCALRPGELVVEAVLARQHGVSRTPVREALRRLMQDGFVKSSSAAGYTVAPITVSDVKEVYNLRVILEGVAAELASQRITDKEIETIEKLLIGLPDMTLTHENEARRLEYLNANTQFHMAIAQAAGNQRLAKMILGLLEEAARYVFLETTVVGMRGVEESLRVADALRARDAARARQQMEAHIRATYERTVEAILAGTVTGVTLRTP